LLEFSNLYIPIVTILKKYPKPIPYKFQKIALGKNFKNRKKLMTKYSQYQISQSQFMKINIPASDNSGY